MGIEYPCLDLFTGQGAADEPGAPFEEGDAAAVTGQALDAQALFLARWHLGRTGTTGRLEAQTAIAFGLGHQLAASKMPVDR
ncbi:hypothetical protein NWF32_13925 [Pseudomonas qingdaonensis]|nr:hypothetical protein [Pseudomonas qingdaonensis]